jgi:UTP--glucose-1-phosphate uridylyltransferase
MKGVIVAAGYGTRFLPVTKTVPKEMLPLLDRPAIDFIMDEFRAAGIRDVLIITSRRKKALDDYFDREVELEQALSQAGKDDALAKISSEEMNVYFVRQQRMLGTGQALLLAKAFVGNDPFIVAYPDDLVFGEVPLSRQLVDVFNQTGKSVLAVQDLKGQDVSRYGVINPASEGNPCEVRALVEKPAAGSEPSTLVSYGRYLFTADLFEELELGLANHQGGEFYHVGAINALAAKGQVVALDFAGLRLDTGAPVGYLEAICRYALMRPDLADQARSLFKALS